MKGYGDAYLYLKDSSYLYKYDLDRQALLPIMKWIDSGMIGDNINQIVPYGDNYLCVYNEDRSSYKLGLLTAVTGEVVNKEAITIAMIYTDSNVQKAIVDYNKSSDKYKIELKTYENEEDPYTALSNDIIAGNVPDILETSNIDLRNYVAKGLLEDLTTFMDSDDTVTKDYFVDGLLDATAIDGKVYNITKFFNLMSIVGKDSDLQAYGDSWTAADMIEYYNSKPEGTSLFQYDSRESVFYTLVMYDLNSYINWETGEVSFDCDEFRNILEFVNKFDTEQDYDKEIDQHQMIKDGKILLETAYFGETTDFQMYKALFDNDIRYIGYPTSDGKGSYISTNYAYSITQTSKNKEEAWNFIKTVLQGKDEYYSGFPSSKVEFEKMIERDMTTEEYTDDDGNVVMPRESTYGFNNFEVKIGPAQEDEIQQLRDMIKKDRKSVV